MQGSVLQILFLGEDSTWRRVSQALTGAPKVNLQAQRVESLTELFRAVSDERGRALALVVDIHAWNFRGLHYVEKVKAQYPTLPIVALYSRAIPEIDAKASACGASRCISFEEFDAESLCGAVESAMAETDTKSDFVLRRTEELNLSLGSAEVVPLTFSKTQVITHALNNLLCVISANADLLSDTLGPNGREARPLFEIKKAARSAAALMRHLK
jgi:DNA-binding NarL/FixJ family response regulator